MVAPSDALRHGRAASSPSSTVATRRRVGRLSWRIYIAFLVAAVLPTAVAGVIGVWLSLDKLRHATTTSLQQEVQARASGLRPFFEMVGAEVQFFATDPAILRMLRLPMDSGAREVARSEIGSAFARLARAQPEVYQIRLLDTTGREQVRVDKRTDGVHVTRTDDLQNKSDRYYVSDAMKRTPGTLYVSPLDLNVEHGVIETPERPVIRIAAVVSSETDQPLGLVIVNLHAQVLLAPVQKMVEAREGTAYLFDRAGQFIARGASGDSPAFAMRPLARFDALKPEARSRLLEEQVGTFLDGGMIWAHSPVDMGQSFGGEDADRWSMAIGFPEDVLLMEVLDLYKLYAVLLAALLVAAAAGYSLSRRLTQPLADLTREAEAITNGNLSRRVKVEGSDEITLLAQQFNDMAATLAANLEDLRRHRARLTEEVTERTRDLTSERARLASILRHAADAIIALRADGQVLFANRAAQQIFRLRESDGGKIPGTVADLARLLPAPAELGARRDVDYHDRVLSVSSEAIDGRDNDTDIVLVARDVTDERQLQDERREFDRQVFQMDKLATLGELAMGLAHEIGNPLAGMKAVAQSLQYEDGLSAEVIAALQRLESEVDRLTRFLSSFRGMTAPRQLRVSPQPLDESVDDMLFWIRKGAQEAGVTIHLDLPADLPPLRADATQLRQLLLNLFINAMHAMPDGGKLSVVGSCIGREVYFEVQDTGHGVPPDLQAHIFRPFFSTRPGGSGLGLAVCAKVVEDHGGHIELNRDDGIGLTRFIIRWPACLDEAVQA